MSIIGKCIASEEKWEGDDDELNIHHFLNTTTGEIFHYDHGCFKMITREEKNEIIEKGKLELTKICHHPSGMSEDYYDEILYRIQEE